MTVRELLTYILFLMINRAAANVNQNAVPCADCLNYAVSIHRCDVYTDFDLFHGCTRNYCFYNPTCKFCTYGMYMYQGQCVPCPLATYQPHPNLYNYDITICLPCSDGTYNPTPGSKLCQTCTTCAPGNYTLSPCQPSINTVCQSCLPGTYNANPSALACTSCAPGTFQPNASSTSCVSCPSGFYQPNASTTACLTCQSGQYAPTATVSACKTCQPGTYQPYSSASACLACPSCPSGSFMLSGCNGLNNITCQPCTTCPDQPAYHANSNSSKTFTPCSLFSDTVCGTDVSCPLPDTSSYYSWMLNGSIKLSTIACRAGNYLSGLNPRSCMQCPAWLVGLNGIYCEPCGPLQAPYIDQASCMCVPPSTMNASGVCVCPDGYYASAGVCLPCPINTMGLGGSCTLCDLGYYSPSTATACTLCDAGKYRRSSDATCQSCGTGMYSQRVEYKVCIKCSTSCPDGYRAEACPGETNSSYMICSPCPNLPDHARWGMTLDANLPCNYTCDAGYYRGNKTEGCLACNTTQCEPGYNKTACTEFADSNCDTECKDETKPRLFSQWTSGCSWACSPGYSLRVTDYWLFKMYECV
jgi:TNFR/NGFR cysteine-rich region/Tyrosine-protein kinase ephrin type A/B receptor-like